MKNNHWSGELSVLSGQYCAWCTKLLSIHVASSPGPLDEATLKGPGDEADTHGAEIFSVVVPSLPELPLVELPRPSPSLFELNSTSQPMLNIKLYVLQKQQ